MKRIDGTIQGYHATKHDLPPAEDRPNPAAVAAMPRWVLHLPGQAIWPNYALCSCSLADFPGVPPANKFFPWATHELQLLAIDPDFPQASLDSGSIAPLEPVNYVAQLKATDEILEQIVEELAVEFINGMIPAEPQGVMINNLAGDSLTARQWFHDHVTAKAKLLMESPQQ